MSEGPLKPKDLQRGAWWTIKGREFQRQGAVTEKAFSLVSAIHVQTTAKHGEGPPGGLGRHLCNQSQL